MGEAREFSRYKIPSDRILKGTLEQVNWPVQLATFGGGGCGFYCLVKIPTLQPPKRVFCNFTIDGSDPVKVQGNLIYIKEVKNQEKVIHFYGIQFIEPHRPVVAPIVETLERLKEEGKVQPC